MKPLITHRNGNTRVRESILEEGLAENVSLSLRNSFCLNKESKMKKLLNHLEGLQEQREQLKAWEQIVITSDVKRGCQGRSRSQVRLGPIL